MLDKNNFGRDMIWPYLNLRLSHVRFYRRK